MDSRTLCLDQALLDCKGDVEVTKMFTSGPLGALRPAAMLLTSRSPPPSLLNTSNHNLGGIDRAHETSSSSAGLWSLVFSPNKKHSREAG